MQRDFQEVKYLVERVAYRAEESVVEKVGCVACINIQFTKIVEITA